MSACFAQRIKLEVVSACATSNTLPKIYHCYNCIPLMEHALSGCQILKHISSRRRPNASMYTSQHASCRREWKISPNWFFSHHIFKYIDYHQCKRLSDWWKWWIMSWTRRTSATSCWFAACFYERKTHCGKLCNRISSSLKPVAYKSKDGFSKLTLLSLSLLFVRHLCVRWNKPKRSVVHIIV
jgi:hypothetical protein